MSGAARMRDLYRSRVRAVLCQRCGLARDRDGAKCSSCLDDYRRWRAGLPADESARLRRELRAEAARAAGILPHAVALLDLDADDPARLGARLEDVARVVSLVLAAADALEECPPGASREGALAGIELRAARSVSPRRAASLSVVASRLARGLT